MRLLPITAPFHIALMVILQGAAARATTVRYALVIGNDIGVDETGNQPFEPLRHAEREATLLRDRLISLSNFDPSGRRTRLLNGANRNQVKAAVKALSDQKRRDEKTYGKIDTVFLLYFTGHGTRGELLLRDGPLTAHELGEFFQSMAADFSVGIFDACFAGSLDLEALNAKGMDPAPGLNLFEELPQEVLTAEGNIWYVSSGPGQQSYEDTALGGVFTYFFIEGMAHAKPDGPGIPLDNVWQYARSHTVAYTTARRRPQVPEQYVAKLRAGAPFYLSFPEARNVTLVLSNGLEGRFLLTYSGGSLTQVFEKHKGAAARLSVFPGDAELQLIRRDGDIRKQHLHLKSGSTVVLSALEDPQPAPAVGERSEHLLSKGARLETEYRAVRIRPGLTLLGGVSYGFAAANKRLLHARHNFSLPFRFDRTHMVLKAAAVYGFDQRTFPAFRYQLHAAGAELAGGYTFDFKKIRIDVGAVCQVEALWQLFEDGEKRTGFSIRPAAEVSLLFPTRGRVSGELFVSGGPIYVPGIGQSAPNLWHAAGIAGLTLYVRLF